MEPKLRESLLGPCSRTVRNGNFWGRMGGGHDEPEIAREVGLMAKGEKHSERVPTKHGTPKDVGVLGPLPRVRCHALGGFTFDQAKPHINPFLCFFVTKSTQDLLGSYAPYLLTV